MIDSLWDCFRRHVEIQIVFVGTEGIFGSIFVCFFLKVFFFEKKVRRPSRDRWLAAGGRWFWAGRGLRFL